MIYSVSSELYEEVKARLVDAIDDRGYFSGHIAFTHEGWECRLVVSCFVHRRERALPEGIVREVSDLVPVWWEFHTADSEAERLNDFSFSTLRTLF
ncbi:MAG: hypothetical protein J6R73_02230 [Alistipes sp.]|nr:hypothetical protein [Alistipes sp.]